MGRRWYDGGKLEHKEHTFSDFAACARHLVETGWTTHDKVIGEGGSAGGLLIGAVANRSRSSSAVSWRRCRSSTRSRPCWTPRCP